MHISETSKFASHTSTIWVVTPEYFMLKLPCHYTSGWDGVVEKLIVALRNARFTAVFTGATD
jgi:hypothetical protein